MPSLNIAIAADHPSFAGHFPGQPLLPGVVLVSEALRALLADAESRELLGDSPRLASAKFLSPVLPGQDLRVDWASAGRRIRFEVHAVQAGNTRLAATGQFEGGDAR
jgi:3-hydroxymyristoyl/3-hydroxydecanoyl-(acyl carrier protein) dehydratase